MKALILPPDFPDSKDQSIGGVYIKELVSELSPRMDKIMVICPIPVSLGRTQADRLCTNYDFKNVHVRFPRYLHIPLTKKSGVLFDQIAAMNAKRMAKTIEKEVKNEGFEYDIMHSHFTWPCGHVASILKKKSGKPSVLTLHENEDWLKSELSSPYRCYQDAWSSADCIIRVNSKIAELKRFNDNVICIPNGYDEKEYCPIDVTKARESLGVPLDADVIFSLGKLIPRKGYDYLIRAMSGLVARNPSAKCYIGGAGHLHEELMSLIMNLKLQDHVTLLGFVPQDEMNSWMNACNIYAQPSLSESFGLVQLYAMGCGKPVVATRNGGSEDVVTSEDLGILCDPGDENALRAALETALNRQWNSEIILQNALNFTWGKIAERTVDLYKSLIFPHTEEGLESKVSL